MYYYFHTLKSKKVSIVDLLRLRSIFAYLVTPGASLLQHGRKLANDELVHVKCFATAYDCQVRECARPAQGSQVRLYSHRRHGGDGVESRVRPRRRKAAVRGGRRWSEVAEGEIRVQL